MTTPSPLLDQIQQRLGDATEHLSSVAQQYQDAVAPVAPEEKADAPPPPDPRNQKEYTFDFVYKTTTKTHAGSFTNHVLSIAERQMVGILRARYAAGTTYDQLDYFTAELNAMVAHLEVSLKTRPGWAQKLTALDDYELIRALYREVTLHEATFLGYDKGEASSPATSTDKDDGAAKVVG